MTKAGWYPQILSISKYYIVNFGKMLTGSSSSCMILVKVHSCTKSLQVKGLTSMEHAFASPT